VKIQQVECSKYLGIIRMGNLLNACQVLAVCYSSILVHNATQRNNPIISFIIAHMMIPAILVGATSGSRIWILPSALPSANCHRLPRHVCCANSKIIVSLIVFVAQWKKQFPELSSTEPGSSTRTRFHKTRT